MMPYLQFQSLEKRYGAVTALADINLTVKRGDVSCMTQDACANKAEVTLCTIQNGGHTWPGALPFAIMGHTSQDIRATDAMWEFFQKHPMP